MHRAELDTGHLVKCKWFDPDHLAITIEYESRKSYRIYRVYDFYSEEYYWVDEEDLEKL
tara:strand:+ start:58 stop:234 length:177 start_codon:yes stop_codon:yes gene_type:complete